ncbi:hypothetical protein [Aquimarina litoralis]|uniref:hypothetical protein n=1 Tax=Aquimarina litoralis TaxID=584605 RepID=UPI001C577C32|nr:hypothetical protein [Aquimarina litoralis]MBW1296410.1 hypothetical protein [Aquimarina litoralis]
MKCKIVCYSKILVLLASISISCDPYKNTTSIDDLKLMYLASQKALIDSLEQEQPDEEELTSIKERFDVDCKKIGNMCPSACTEPINCLAKSVPPPGKCMPSSCPSYLFTHILLTNPGIAPNPYTITFKEKQTGKITNIAFDKVKLSNLKLGESINKNTNFLKTNIRYDITIEEKLPNNKIERFTISNVEFVKKEFNQLQK